MAEFNSYANPKVETKRFKIYADVGTGETPEWELQGRGVPSWTITTNSSITKTPDVLGMIDMEREPAQKTQGVEIKLRKNSKFGAMVFDAFFRDDNAKIDAMTLLQKFEFVDGTEEGTCLAKLERDVMLEISEFTGEAGGYLGFTGTFHYANNSVIGTMPKVDGETITFTPDDAA